MRSSAIVVLRLISLHLIRKGFHKFFFSIWVSLVKLQIMKPILSVAILFCVSVRLFAQHSVTKLWETDTLLKVPESVLFDADNKVLYASNIDGTDPWGKDGKGSIAKIGLDGKIIA